ncbi:MAG: hypothetical protein ACYTEG_01425 [Planctomycetota bacterium]
MSDSNSKQTGPGMIAVAAGLTCALVAGIFIRDYSESELVRFAVPCVAAVVGIVVAFKVCEVRDRGKD